MTLAIDLEAVDDLIRAIAAEHILPRFRRLASHEVQEKSPGNLVTVADTEAERALTSELRRLMPGSAVVGEKAVAADPLVLDRLAGEAPVWILDPVDGTMNFTRSIARFAVMVALSWRGIVQAGWIHDPVAGDTAVAMLGKGSILRHADGSRESVRRPPPPPLGAMRGAAAGRIGERGRARDILERSGRVGPLTRVNSAGHEYLDLLRGRHHYVSFSRALPWDHAPGVLIFREAGGEVAYIDGRGPADVPYSPLRHHGPLLAAPTAEAWSALRGILMTA
jgi:fructose-1,6-bisphosphatase/inositol monophosphatase family enzyme